MRIPLLPTPTARTTRSPSPGRLSGAALLLLSLSSFCSASANPIDIRGALGAAVVAKDDAALRLPVRRQSSDNLQTFGEALGGKSAAAITDSGDGERVFAVDGDTFVSGSLGSSVVSKLCVLVGYRGKLLAQMDEGLVGLMQ